MRELKLDLDGRRGLQTLEERLWITKWLGLRIGDAKVKDTVNGFHAILTCDNEIDDVKAAFIQALLGSDYRRELCNLLKIERGSKEWNVLFEKKYKVGPLSGKCQVSEEKDNPQLSEKLIEMIRLGE